MDRHRAPQKRLSRSRTLNRKFAFVLLGASIPLLVLALVLANSLLQRENRVSHGPRLAESVGAADGEIRIPLAKTRGAEAAFYQFPAGDKEPVRFFVADAAGRHHVALDDCGVCRLKRGFRQDGEMMVCNYCDLKFAIASLGGSSDRCVPIPVPARFETDQLVIAASDLRTSR